MKKYFLSFHTVFLLNENVQWLEEFIIYYTKIGFDHFYLYDNDGSTGGDGSKTKNKYGFDVTTQSTNEDRDKLEKILDTYGDLITYVTWQPKDHNGNIWYGQKQATDHFVETYGHETEWTAFMDLDEFLFSPTDIDIRKYLEDQDDNTTCIKLIQKKFVDRFLSTDVNITQDYRCIDNLKIGTEWAAKNILKPDHYKGYATIHGLRTDGRTIVADVSILRFNHYNVNDKQLRWMSGFYKRSFEINGTDDGMLRYKEYIEANKKLDE
jgi:Glycosyltransferase family 92